MYTPAIPTSASDFGDRVTDNSVPVYYGGFGNVDNVDVRIGTTGEVWCGDTVKCHQASFAEIVCGDAVPVSGEFIGGI